MRDQTKINTCRRKAINTVPFRSPFLISPTWQISVRFGYRADRTASRRVLSAPYVLIVVVSWPKVENSGRRFSGRCYRRTTFAILDSPWNSCYLFPSIARHSFPISTDRGKYVNLPRNVTQRHNHEHEGLVRPYPPRNLQLFRTLYCTVLHWQELFVLRAGGVKGSRVPGSTDSFLKLAFRLFLGEIL